MEYPRWKIIFFSGILFANSYIIRGQENREPVIDIRRMIFQGNHLSFSFSVFLTAKARLSEQSGSYPVSSSVTPGLLLGANYHINLNNYHSLRAGVQATNTGRNFNISVAKNDFSPPLIKDYVFNGRDTYLADLILSLSILFEKRWFYRKERYLFTEAGIQLNVSTGADYDLSTFSVQDVNNNFHDVAEVNVYANNDAKPWISFSFNVGHGWVLKNNNLLKLATTTNISFTKYVNGTYRVNVPNQPLTQGTYSSTGSYLGLSLSYVFTSANYRIRKAYEKSKTDLDKN